MIHRKITRESRKIQLEVERDVTLNYQGSGHLRKRRGRLHTYGRKSYCEPA